MLSSETRRASCLFRVSFYTHRMNNIIIRHARTQDAFSIAKVQVETWQSAYKWLIPQSHLDTLHVSQKAEKWERKIGLWVKPIFVAEHDWEVVWFIAWWRSREKTSYDGEVMAFYVLESYQWSWIGSKLLENIKMEFKKLGFSSFYVWVLENGPARDFYEKKWGEYIDKKTEKLWNIEVVEVSYGWKYL
jgi:GNAT superfamily N-acetyltransferase